MKAQMLAIALALGLVATAQAASFPYTNCQQAPSSYSVNSVVTVKPPSTYCFKIEVNVPPGCNSYCCKADLRKFELNVNPSCKISGVKLSATLNGVPTASRPTLDPAPNTAAGVILRITNLGLTMDTADGAEICVTLGTNSAGKGCLSLDQLCVPPVGGVPGECNTALWDSKFDCCPVDIVGVPDQPLVVPPINCTCDYNPGSTPFVASGIATATVNAKTTTYCMPISTTTDYVPSGCGAVDNLLKVELYAKQALSASIKSLSLVPATGSPVTLSASWGGANSNILKFTPVNWNVAKATNAKICVELKAGTTLSDLCFGPTCSLFLFNSNKACCPLYRVSSLPVP
ncbi:hypothetical protein Vretimale_7509 [Volvox reticuliferus]|uniref:Uncharacterized protein n=1 Tax=Volvox reticuliferus TaxID=1737510 RepID=A0A8J4LLM3_9CHLO|nr:hypothetical protein Vretifemale_7580 [Volvox reticuliferus]GIM02688.1 hypothetical protein Vretimale_7509 [Volvox reticuliferus]